MELPTLRQLEYAVAVADLKSFRQAAEATHVSQPGLSAQIQQLERTLGTPLFERDRRGVRLTPAGEEIVRRARRVLTEAQDLVEIGRGFGEPLTGSLRLGVIPTVAPYLLPITLPDLRKELPALRLLLREDLTPHLVRDIEEGRLDCAIVALETELGELRTAPIGEDPFVLAVPKGHPLGKRKRISLSDLPSDEVLLLEDGHCLRDQTLELCQRAEVPSLADFRATSLNTLVRMVASGFGVTILPEMAVASEVHKGDALTILRITPCPSREIALAWRPSSPRFSEFSDLADAFRRSWRKRRS
ncbi:MAG: LysR substrate-binding domain-containing protein [Planctomycetota bacterium]